MTRRTSMGRIETEFRAKRADGRKLLVPYITGGYPGWQDAIRAAAAERRRRHRDRHPVLRPGDGRPGHPAGLAGCARRRASRRRRSSTRSPTLDVGIPLAVMTYYNLVHHAGHERFADRLVEAGIVAAASCPTSRSRSPGRGARPPTHAGIETVMLAAPDRARRAAAARRRPGARLRLLGRAARRHRRARRAGRHRRPTLAARLKAITDVPGARRRRRLQRRAGPRGDARSPTA